MKSKTFSLFLVLLMALCLVIPSANAATAVFTPGTYTASANGRNGPVTVETTVTEDLIAKVEIVKHFETNGVWQVLDVVPQRIVEEQSLAVDTVAGATFSGRAVLLAVEDCLKQAGADVSLFKTARPEEAPKEEEYAADVIVIGGGGSGLASGVSAHQNGASVIVIEKLGMPGGSTIFSGGAFNAADPVRQANIEMTESNVTAMMKLLDKEAHDEQEAAWQEAVRTQYQAHVDAGHTWLFDCPELHMLQTYNGGDYEGDTELIRVMCENALSAVEWQESLGAKLKDTTGMATGAIWQRSHYGTDEEYPNGFSSVFPYVRYIDANEGIELHLNTRAIELIQGEDGRVVGVKATRGNDTITYTANKGVVMATGGFGANVEMRQHYNTQWDNLDASIGCSNQYHSAQGDGITMGLAVGAQLIDMGLIQLHPNGEVGTGDMMGNPHTSGLNRIFINKNGERFVAEDSRRDVLVNAIYGQEDGYMWIVADSTRYPAGTTSIENAVILGKTLKADTLEELAELIDVPAENLQASIEQYNRIVDGEVDPLGLSTYGVKLGNAPYYAAKRIPTVHHTMGGLKIDTSCHVLDEADQVIPGFYAAGEVTGDIHGGNRLGGNAITDVNVFGRIAGASAATGE